MNKGYVFAPYIIAESINVVSESNKNMIQGISSRYGKAWKSKSEIRIEKIKKILESIDS
jgi:hypothetical protein